MNTFDLVEHLKRQIAFSQQTFGPGTRTKGISKHIEKELKEIAGDPLSLEEWVDIILLSLDGAWRTGHSAEDVCNAMKAKLDKNKKRTWPDWRDSSPDDPIEHIDNLE
jgi:hypothetical protein